MTDFLNNYYKSINIEEEKKKLFTTNENTIQTDDAENQEIGVIESALDPVLAVSNKF